MKKMMMTLIALLTMSAAANAMSYEQACNEALFLTDKMAYELDLTDEQYEAAYEINLDYLMSVTSPDDVYGIYWERRNLDMSYILYSWQWEAFRAAAYFFRPLYWNAGRWHFGIYARYTVRDYLYFGRPHFYVSYRGGHAWHANGGHSYYYGRRDHFRPAVNDRYQHYGMRQRFDNHNGHRPGSSTRITAGNRDHNRGYGNIRPGIGNDRNRGFGNNRNRGNGNDRNRGFGNNRNRGNGNDRNRGFGNNNNRGYGNDRPNMDNRPNTDNDRPNMGNRPNTGNDRTSSGNRNFGNDRSSGNMGHMGNMGARQNFNSGSSTTTPSLPSTTTRPSTTTTSPGRHFGGSSTTTSRPATTTSRPSTMTSRPTTTTSTPTRSFGGSRSSSTSHSSATRSSSTPSRSFSSGSSNSRSGSSSSSSRSFGSSHSSSSHSSSHSSSGGSRSHFGGGRH